MNQTKITLTPEQEQAKDRLLAFMNSDARAIILQGHAGTGKTTIIKEVERQRKAYEKLMNIIDKIPTYEWAYTAMTHKAREALELSLGHKAKTLHKYLGLRLTSAGRLLLQGYRQHTAEYTLLIVDECSYLDYILLDYLNKYLDLNPTIKIILLGDKNQLPPVGLNHCPVYYSNLEEITLTQSVRQKDSPLIDEAASMFRNMVTTNQLHPVNTDDAQVIVLSKKQWDKQMVTSFEEGHNTKVIRHSNHQVNQTNTKLFKHFNGRHEYKQGDTVICNSYHQGIYSDTSMVITGVEPTTHCGLDLYIIQVLAEDGTCWQLYIPQKRSELNKRLAELEVKGDESSAVLLKNFKNFIADIRPMYACTVHKSQGSTYDEVFINLSDFKRMYVSDSKMTARLLYVAFSRAKHRVYLTGDIV